MGSSIKLGTKQKKRKIFKKQAVMHGALNSGRSIILSFVCSCFVVSFNPMDSCLPSYFLSFPFFSFLFFLSFLFIYSNPIVYTFIFPFISSLLPPCPHALCSRTKMTLDFCQHTHTHHTHTFQLFSPRLLLSCVQTHSYLPSFRYLCHFDFLVCLFLLHFCTIRLLSLSWVIFFSNCVCICPVIYCLLSPSHSNCVCSIFYFLIILSIHLHHSI